jgi:hypothetical protein
MLENDGLPFCEATFYNLSKKCWVAAKKVFTDSQASLLNDLLQLSEDIVISFDMGWHKRYGFNSDLGRFCVFNFNLRKIIFGGVKNKGREAGGHEVMKSNYTGSSKGMEQSALEDFITWSAANGLLPLIKIACCDKDSSTHKLLREDSRCSHIELLYDPGHIKKSFQGSLMKIFGTSKALESFAPRLASWMMRSLSEAKSFGGTDRSAIQEKFTSLMSYMIPHYTRAVCPVQCPCHAIPHYSVQEFELEATDDSSLSSDKDLIFYTIMKHMDSESLATASLVCHHWNTISQNVLAYSERRQKKVYLPRDSPLLPQVEELVEKLLADSKMLCHPYHTCLVESSHNQCLSFGEKRVNYYNSYEGRTFASYSKFNLGWNWIVKFYENLGIPVSDILKAFLKKKDKKSQYHRDRQQSVEYKLRAKVLSVKKKQKKVAADKISKKRGHDYSESKELYPAEKTLKKRKLAPQFEIRDRVFGVFGSLHYLGVVLNVDTEILESYMVCFIDGEVRDVKPSDLVAVDRVKPEKKCWVPAWIHRFSITRDEFDEHYDYFNRKLRTEFREHEKGLIFASDSEDDSDDDI